MTAPILTRPKKVRINRADLRQHLRGTLERAKGRTIVEISAHDEKDEKLLVDKIYFEELVQYLRAVMETLEIATDQKLFDRIMRAGETLKEDTRLGSCILLRRRSRRNSVVYLKIHVPRARRSEKPTQERQKLFEKAI